MTTNPIYDLHFLSDVRDDVKLQLLVHGNYNHANISTNIFICLNCINVPKAIKIRRYIFVGFVLFVYHFS